MYSKLNPVEIIKLYSEGASTHELAQKFNTYPNRIRRILKKGGNIVRSKSEAQKLALSTGRHEHPTKGKVRDDKTKLSIAEGLHQYWEDIPEDERAARVEKAQEQWANMEEIDKVKIRELAAKAVRKAAKTGSKIEIFFKNYLTERGFHIIFHKKGLIANDKLEVDIFIPDLNTAIEIDGPAHFLPIWGHVNLQRHVIADAKKSGLLIGAGFCLIRVKNIKKNISEIQMLHAAQEVENRLREIKLHFPDKTKRFIELEV